MHPQPKTMLSQCPVCGDPVRALPADVARIHACKEITDEVIAKAARAVAALWREGKLSIWTGVHDADELRVIRRTMDHLADLLPEDQG